MIYHSYQRRTNLHESIYGRYDYPVYKYRKKPKLRLDTFSNISHKLTDISLGNDWFCSDCKKRNKEERYREALHVIQ